MELLNLPIDLLNQLFGNGAFFSNWISFFIANWMALALGGFVLSKWLDKQPQGMINREKLAKKITKDSSWYIVFSLIGITLAVAYNIGMYALFLLLEATTFVTNFVYKWASLVIIWLWKEVFIPSVWMLAKLLFHYLIKWPFSLLLKIINAVPSTLNRSSYLKVLWPTLYASLISALCYFLGFLFEAKALQEYAWILIFTLCLVWIVANQIYNERVAAVRAMKFAGILICLIGLVYSIGYTLNFWDASLKWGGFITGLWHVPSVLGACMIFIVLSSLLYLSNVGVIYANENSSQKLSERIYSYIKLAFQHGLAFIYQPIFVILISGVIVVIPWVLLDKSADFVAQNWVNTHLDSSNITLQNALKKHNVASKMTKLIDANQTNDTTFESALIQLEREHILRFELAENERYRTYLDASQVFGENELQAIVNRTTFDEKVKSDSLSLQKMRVDQKTQIQQFKDQINLCDDQIVDINASINSNPELADFLMPMRNEINSMRNGISIKMERYKQFMNVQIAATKKTNQVFVKNWFAYCSTYLLFLLANYALLALIIAFVFNLYSQTVRPIFDAYNGSHLVASIEQERSRNANQPWLAWLLLVLFYVIYSEWAQISSYINQTILEFL
jgi:hypothetical protein